MSDVAVELRGLSERFVGQPAVDDLSFEVPGGGIVGFLGPNGAGKSTTMRMIIGLTAPTAGSATIFGVPSTPSRIPPAPSARSSTGSGTTPDAGPSTS